MNTIARIDNTKVEVINFKSVPVLTTEQLASFYETDARNIRKNYSNNKSRFVEGKHFFKITGQELKEFASSLKLITKDLLVNNVHPQISNKTRVLTLWTERGASRHAKMLDTDQAWDVFEKLEECYFHRKSFLEKTHKTDRTPLHHAVSMLVAKTTHLSFSDAWRLVNQRFNTNTIDEIPYEEIPTAVEYVHHLIALHERSRESARFNKDHLELVRDLVENILMQNFMLGDVWRSLYELDTRKYLTVMKYVVESNVTARNAIGLFELRTKDNQPMISKDFCTIQFYNGVTLTKCNPNWFNAPA